MKSIILMAVLSIPSFAAPVFPAPRRQPLMPNIFNVPTVDTVIVVHQNGRTYLLSPVREQPSQIRPIIQRSTEPVSVPLAPKSKDKTPIQRVS